MLLKPWSPYPEGDEPKPTTALHSHGMVCHPPQQMSSAMTPVLLLRHLSPYLPPPTLVTPIPYPYRLAISPFLYQGLRIVPRSTRSPLLVHLEKVEMGFC